MLISISKQFVFKEGKHVNTYNTSCLTSENASQNPKKLEKALHILEFWSIYFILTLPVDELCLILLLCHFCLPDSRSTSLKLHVSWRWSKCPPYTSIFNAVSLFRFDINPSSFLFLFGESLLHFLLYFSCAYFLLVWWHSSPCMHLKLFFFFKEAFIQKCICNTYYMSYYHILLIYCTLL